MDTFISFILAYFIGAVPFGVLAGKACGVDVRSVGSGNIGATNVYRVLGPKVGAIVFLLDVLKGVAGPFIARLMLGDEAQWPIALCGLMVAIGHVFSVFLGFKGGKAIATGLGVYGALSFPVAASCLAFWGIVLLLTRMVSLASIAACLATPVACFVFGLWHSNLPASLVMCLVALVAFLKHVPNMKRIAAGTEPRIGEKKTTTESKIETINETTIDAASSSAVSAK